MTQTRDDFGARLRLIGAEQYHDLHPFHDLLHGGGCTPDRARAWVTNRCYYQHSIPIKETAFMSRVEKPYLRRARRSRIEDHDQTAENEGGIRHWLRLAEAVGLDPDHVASRAGALPIIRFSVDGYVRFVREKTLLESIAASLTEFFAPKIHANRIQGLLKNDVFVDNTSRACFKNRLKAASKDVAAGLAWVLNHTNTAEKQDTAVKPLEFKTNVLWSQLDALWRAYVEPGRVPTSAWTPGEGLLFRKAS